MLLNTIKNYDTDGTIKLVCVEAVLKSGKTLPKIHSVPALLTFPAKELLFGKEVFDYLFLSGRGKLLNARTAPENSVNPKVEPTANGAEPSPFNMNSMGLSDNFSAIDDPVYNDSGDAHRLYNWSSINDVGSTSQVSQMMDAGMLQESRTKKELPDISEYKARRDLEIDMRDLNVSTMKSAVPTR